MNPLLDKDFLLKLDNSRLKEKYVRITALSQDELPLQVITGRATGGSVSVDGNSAVRRSCNLTMIAENVDLNNFYWGLSNKFKLEIGLKNNINKNYDNIIWFKQGIYVITSFNATLNQTTYNISIGGKDKMCLLNGEISGSLPSSIDFGKIDETEEVYTPVKIKDKVSEYKAYKYYIRKEDEKYELATGEYNESEQYYLKDIIVNQRDLTIEEIIRESVHKYANEPYYNIIINNVEDYGLELMQYRGDKPLYLFYNEGLGVYDNMTTDGTLKLTVQGTTDEISIDNPNVKYNNAVDELNEERTHFIITLGTETKEYSITKVEYGEVCGYSSTALTYPGDLISKVGETLTSMLDKIKNMLGAFEYFYDIDGHFVFQLKKTYSQISWSSLIETDSGVSARSNIEASPYAYNFQNTELIQSFQSTPGITNIKNDYSVWGVRETTNGAQIPIHARYAIAKKPISYTTIAFSEDEARKYPDLFKDPKKAEQENSEFNSEDYDWRELLYRMAKDYYKYGQTNEFYLKIKEANVNSGLYQTGITGYEAFYEDIYSFWRDLYNPEEEVKLSAKDRTGEYTLVKEWSKDNLFYTENIDWIPAVSIMEYEYETEGDYKFWKKSIIEDPSTLNFWIDFYEDGGDQIQQYSIHQIGNRLKSINDSKITNVLQKKIPNVVFTTYSKDDYIQTIRGFSDGYIIFTVQPWMYNLFTIASSGKSAKEEIEELFNKHGVVNETIQLTSIPIYYLEPNTLIKVYSEKNNINGEYEMTRFTIPLNYNSMMSISAQKVFR